MLVSVFMLAVFVSKFLILFSIGKLCDDPPRDVYGRPTKLPDFNLFVAGTSCKNFSGLRTKFKLGKCLRVPKDMIQESV